MVGGNRSRRTGYSLKTVGPSQLMWAHSHVMWAQNGDDQVATNKDQSATDRSNEAASRLIVSHRAMFKPLQTTINLDVGLHCNQPINDL